MILDIGRSSLANIGYIDMGIMTSNPILILFIKAMVICPPTCGQTQGACESSLFNFNGVFPSNNFLQLYLQFGCYYEVFQIIRYLRTRNNKNMHKKFILVLQPMLLTHGPFPRCYLLPNLWFYEYLEFNTFFFFSFLLDS